MNLFQKMDALVKEHHKVISPAILVVLLVSFLGLGFPMLLLADELTSTTTPSFAPPPPVPIIGTQGVPGGQSNGMMQPREDSPDGQDGIMGRVGQGDALQADQRDRADSSRDNAQNGLQSMQTQQLEMTAQMAKRIEQQLKEFQRLIDRFSKRGIAVPPQITSDVTSAGSLLEKIKGDTTLNSTQSDLADLQDRMQSLNDDRMMLGRLEQWTQMEKQANRMLARLDKMVQQDKIAAQRLAKNGIDVSDLLNTVTTDVQNLHTVHSQAVATLATDPGQAIDSLQNDFFGSLDDVKNADQVIKQMSHLGSFQSMFKHVISQAESTVKGLQKQNVDTTELQAQLDDVKAKGADVAALMQAKPLDEEALMAALQDAEDAQQTFKDTVQELSGDTLQPSNQVTGSTAVIFQPFSTSVPAFATTPVQP